MVPERVDTGALPMTEPHSAPFFDTGPHPDPLVFYDSDALEFVDYTPPADAVSDQFARPSDSGMHMKLSSVVSPVRLPAPAHPVAVPGQFQFVKRWKYALLMVGVWIAAAAIGLGMYYWWFHSVDKTWPDAGVLLYVIVCVVAALLVAMTETKPMLTVLALGIMMSPFASACGAASLYGAYAFGWVVP